MDYLFILLMFLVVGYVFWGAFKDIPGKQPKNLQTKRTHNDWMEYE